MSHITVTENGVTKLLKGINPFKATGPDEIPAFIMKNTADSLSPYLTYLYQFSLDTGTVPDDWRKANVVPIYKKGEKHVASNYRPVSLTSIVCKLLEHIIHSTVMGHFEHHRILCDEQHGFRARRSCESQLLITIDKIARNIEEGHQTDIILLDFAKAFDKVPHTRLLHKLEYYGVRDCTLQWIRDFLSHRSQSVVLEGHTSDPLEVVYGVPQGTVLGPLLFLAYINDMPEATTSDVRLFADDSLLFRKIRNRGDPEKLQADLDRLEEWEKRWQMSFHPSKCTVIRVTGRRKPMETKYTLHGHTLEVVNSGKYLGVTVSNTLRWNEHIQTTSSKAHRTLGFLRRNLGRSTPQVKVTAYTALVRPILEYASTVWDPHQVTSVRELEGVQIRAARFVFNTYTDTSPGCVTNLLDQLGWEPLQARRTKNRLVMCYKINHQLIDINPGGYYTSGDSRTRGSRNLRQIRAQKDTYHHSFFPKSIRDWNSIPEEAKSATSLEDFKARLSDIPWPRLTSHE
ncbi:hypothetical protein FSP39_013376 [Pinctada imbricata]|uniref:Reverse transcriptase domain-containing protein n=1 Tax=Pinctada imbricata TaxID=66713 RepID=A0AA88XD57_PINIB|nr:hypothetical protein FSP39_013376 [Pinctada imbricata]